MKLKRIIKLVVLIPIVAACDDMFEPTVESIEDFDAVTAKPANAAGIMGYGYQNLPYQGSSARWFNDVATDDAVSNDDYSIEKENERNPYLKVGNGQWSSKNGGVNPFNQWTDRRLNLQYVNRFLEEMDKFTWAGKEVVNEMFKDQIKGEALALRGLQLFYFLRSHAGYVDGSLMGVPFLTHSETAGDDFNVGRSSFKDCIEQIMKDLEEAQTYLPYDYADIKDSEIPEKYAAIGVINASDYNRVFGETKMGRMSGRIAAALEAQVALFAASPAYSDQSGVTWEDAAKKAAVLLNTIGGPSGIDPNGNHWYNNLEEIRASMGGKMPAEIIWRGNISETNGLEKDCYPFSLRGNARINPTQNLVDAFPMANGYPITEAASGYDPQNPYEGRDPRFDLYIVHDGSDFGPNRSTDKRVNENLINTTVDDSNNEDGLDAEKSGAPTRTGYFMRKLLNEDCINAMKDGTGMSAQLHYDARIRYTEIFLAYAEAANEAFGPKGTAAGASYSAYDVIKAIRERAGITDTKYLDECAGDKDKMRELIRNERRIELCFEGHRFWDLRRWKVDLSKLNEPVRAMEIKTVNGKKTYTVVDVKKEKRDYDECMYYGPVPESELNKWSALKQNNGWEKF
ncbi:MAG: RagB/SusD family nutrient uptake outer membrane protein [Salinivirgaceae bacterium]|nr:RagB/SusD family nutrient uptake outer membrane protein [Salinivirgaceae bacterium]